MSELYELTNGEGIISLRGDNFDTALLLGGKPIAFSWGASEQFRAYSLVRGTPYKDYQRDLDQIRDLVKGFHRAGSLTESLLSLLRLFDRGQYSLSEDEVQLNSYLRRSPLNPSRTSSDVTYDIRSFDTSLDHVSYQSSYTNEVLITTQPDDLLKDEVIKAYEQKIKNGERPLLILTKISEHTCHFVLDGHHKLRAYQNLDITPRAITITEVTTKTLDLQTGIMCLGMAEHSPHTTDMYELGKRINPPIYERNEREITGRVDTLYGVIRDQNSNFAFEILCKAPQLIETVAYDGFTPLITAAEYGNYDIAEVVIELGANVHAKDSDGYTALHHAARNNYPAIVELLVSGGADINAVNDYGTTPLGTASVESISGNHESIKKLIELGANVHAKVSYGDTALHYAAFNNYPAIVELLVSGGADINAVNDCGDTPLADAISCGSQDSIKKLIELGAFLSPQ